MFFRFYTTLLAVIAVTAITALGLTALLTGSTQATTHTVGQVLSAHRSDSALAGSAAGALHDAPSGVVVGRDDIATIRLAVQPQTVRTFIEQADARVASPLAAQPAETDAPEDVPQPRNDQASIVLRENTVSVLESLGADLVMLGASLCILLASGMAALWFTRHHGH